MIWIARLPPSKELAAQLGGDPVKVNDHAQVFCMTIENAGEAAFANAVHIAYYGMDFHVLSSQSKSADICGLSYIGACCVTCASCVCCVLKNWPKRKTTTLSGLEIPKRLGIFSPVQIGQR